MSLPSPKPNPVFTPKPELPLNARGRFQPRKRQPLALSKYCPPPPRPLLAPKSALHEMALRLQTNSRQTLSPEQKEDRRQRNNVECGWANAFRRKRKAERKPKNRICYEEKQAVEAEEIDVFWDVLHRVHSLNVGYRFLESP